MPYPLGQRGSKKVVVMIVVVIAVGFGCDAVVLVGEGHCTGRDYSSCSGYGRERGEMMTVVVMAGRGVRW